MRGRRCRRRWRSTALPACPLLLFEPIEQKPEPEPARTFAAPIVQHRRSAHQPLPQLVAT